MKSKLSRRHFLWGTASTVLVSGCATTQSGYLTRKTTLAKSGYHSPNEKLNIACIGIGGKGHSDAVQCSGENIVALCDVDWNQGAGIFNRFPDAKRYKDFRKMLDEVKEIDAVTVSTPDHIHALAATRAMGLGKHVFVQKPLTHSVHEARVLRETARQVGVATQMGNNGAASAFQREFIEMYIDGAVGQVHEVHSWTDRPTGWWPQGIDHELPNQEVPEHLDWDLWQGPAPHRAYNEGYCPFKWRGWWDYGTGALGDIACHNLSAVKKALQLGYPDWVECIHIQGENAFTYPLESIVRFHFPQRGELDPVDVYWYDGKLKPSLPEDLVNKERIDIEELLADNSGNLMIGESGIITMKRHQDINLLIKEGEIVEDYHPPKILPRLPHISRNNNPDQEDDDTMHKLDWIQSCKTGWESGSNFEHAGVLTEFVLLGNIAIRYPHQHLTWDGEHMRITNFPEANRWIKKAYPPGWELV